MIEIGINDGDYVVVKEQPAANNGDVVVAIVEDGATVKTFYKERDHVRLQPENSSMDPIIVRENVSIDGKVVAVFRRLSAVHSLRCRKRSEGFLPSLLFFIHS